MNSRVLVTTGLTLAMVLGACGGDKDEDKDEKKADVQVVDASDEDGQGGKTDTMAQDTTTAPEDTGGSGVVDAGGTVDAGPADAGKTVDAAMATDTGGTADAGMMQDAGGEDAGVTDAGMDPDAGNMQDAGMADAGNMQDAGMADAGTDPDAGNMQDAGDPDAGPQDAGTPDAGPQDTGAPDAGPQDTGTPDAGPQDAGASDAGTPAPAWATVWTTVIQGHKCLNCHGGASGAGGFGLGNNAAETWTATVGKSAMGACNATLYIKVGDANASVLYHKIKSGVAPGCGGKMPPGSNGIPDADAAMLKAWIDAGAKQ